MANKTLNVTILMRNDPAITWREKNPILAKGEIGIETDTRKLKIGDGATVYKALKYASGGNIELKTTIPSSTDLEYEVGTIWVNADTQQIFMLFAKTTSVATWIEIPTSNGSVAISKVSEKIKTPRTIAFNGAVVSNSKAFDGSENITYTLVLSPSGVEQGTYTKLTVNDKGVITSATNLSASDIPELTLSKITDAGTASNKNVGVSAGNVPIIGSDGKIDAGILPSLAITNTFVVSNQSEMLHLNAQEGDIAIRTDESKTYILTNKDPSTVSNWVVLRTPDCKVLSVNSKTGAIVLTSSDIAEGSNLYFTDLRATTNFNANFVKKKVSDLSDGLNVIMLTDKITFDGGQA